MNKTHSLPAAAAKCLEKKCFPYKFENVEGETSRKRLACEESTAKLQYGIMVLYVRRACPELSQAQVVSLPVYVRADSLCTPPFYFISSDDLGINPLCCPLLSLSFCILFLCTRFLSKLFVSNFVMKISASVLLAGLSSTVLASDDRDLNGDIWKTPLTKRQTSWAPPAALVTPLEEVWAHVVETYNNGDLFGFKNYGYDTIMASGG